MKALDYPFDGIAILKQKKTLKQQLLSQGGFIEKRIAILSGSTVGYIADILELFLLNFGIKPQFYIGQYNRFYEDVIFENNELTDFKPELILIHTTTRNLPDREIGNKLKVVWEKIQNDFSCPVIQNNFELSVYSSELETCEIEHLNTQIANFAKENRDFYINNIHYLSARVGLDEWFSDRDYFLSKYAFSVSKIPLFCHNAAKLIKSIYGKNQKCLVLDLDNTLWGGVVGEVGVMGIELGPETSLGEAYVAFQRYVKQLHDKGVVLAICSKNDENVAKKAFSNPYMVLSLDDIAVFCANWNRKSENILKIAEQLNILPESIVFIDDNPAERELVRQALPDVSVPDVVSVVDFIRHIEDAGFFDTANITNDDIKRNEYYIADAKRNAEKRDFLDYGDYLRSLEMSGEIRPFVAMHLDRITQLINKTNQFNLTTKRYSLSEIGRIAADSGFIALYATLDDKFGNNGIVSALIGEIAKNTLHIHLWVMSCRVFKRDLEFAIFDYLVEICKSRGLDKIIGYYFKTEKNCFVAELFDNLGFVKTTEESWEFVVIAEYQPRNKYIKIEGDVNQWMF